MAAVAHVWLAEAPRLVVIRTTPPAAPAVVARPSTRYRRRRAAALLIVVGLLTGLLLIVQALLASFAWGPAAGPASQPVEGRSAVYVVQPGDTFWEIARRLRPADDPRPLVSRMVAEHGSPVLMAGERLPVPAPG